MEVVTVEPPTTVLGGSLPVANVQALAASGATVPSRYIRPEAAEEEVVGVVGSGDAEVGIPVVDMARLQDPGTSTAEGRKLQMACEDWGFFQLINHGISDAAVRSIKANVEEFFGQPLEARMASAQPPGTVEGYGHAFVVSEEQKLDWGDMLFLYTEPRAIRNGRLWPGRPATFGDALDAYAGEVKGVASCLLSHLLGLAGSDPQLEKVRAMFDDGVQAVRMNYYPACPRAHDRVVGLSPHADPVALTLLLQVGQVPGLQIRRGGKWLPVHPEPGALVVNVGDVVEILSNGKYKSIEHRVMVSQDKERMSIATFHSTNLGAVIGPLDDFCKGDRPRFKSLGAMDYGRLIFASKPEGKNILDQMKLHG